MASTIAAAPCRDHDVSLHVGDLENFDPVEALHIWNAPCCLASKQEAVIWHSTTAGK